MKLIVDTNILLKALIKDSRVRAILLSPVDQFLVPEFAIEEVEAHMGLVTGRSGLSEGEVRLVLSVLLTNIEVVPKEDVLTCWGRAEEIMGSIDVDDVPFVAASLSRSCDGIWSDDGDLKRQNAVRVWTTSEMVQKR
ncbi:MAG: PIN domain-containing protein [Candidatus Bathyarchaeota archaeon]|nr:PIN domain-containing protein [Candidatus Bathyarchaeota archaeon]